MNQNMKYKIKDYVQDCLYIMLGGGTPYQNLYPWGWYIILGAYASGMMSTY